MHQDRHIIRVEKNTNYTTINNTSMQDTRLSWKAKGIHAFMLTRPDNWVFYNEEMQEWAKDGRDSLLAGIKELQKYGYIRKERRRNENGKFDYITIVYEVPCEDEQDTPPTGKPSTDLPSTDLPCTEKPLTEKPLTGKPLTENPTLISTNTLNTNTLNTNTVSTDVLSTKELKKHEDDEKAAPAKLNPFRFHEENGFGLISSFTQEKINFWIDELSDEHVLYAMQLAVENNAVRWTYVDKILQNWAQRNLKTMADVLAAQAQHEANKAARAKTASYKPKGRTENTPEWFAEHQANKLGQTSAPVTPEQPTAIDFEAERAKILAKLGQ